MPRKYVKKSEFWNLKSSISSNASPAPLAERIAEDNLSTPNLSYEDISLSDCRTTGNSAYRSLEGPSTQGIFAQTSFPNISSGVLPYCNKNGAINIREAIELCQRAYANVSVFRSTIDIMTEFSNSKLQLRGGSSASRKFFYKWLEKIGMHSLKEEFFREYYRSGNVFLYKVDGKFNKDDFVQLSGIKNKIPLKYLVLNPVTVAATGGVGYNYNYLKVMSKYEIERFKNPKTDEDKAVFNALPDNVKQQVRSYAGSFSEILMNLEPEKLFYVFYKKQGYEPFAVPMGFPVLNDIEWKLSLKKMDMALARTVDNIILLVTMGAKKEDGGINYKNIEAMQKLLQNQAAGRVIVSDYTTKAEFIIPKLEDILGKEKYEVVNQDIVDGLQNILLGDSKFANQMIKTKVFLERLNEGRDAFIDFIYPEMKAVAENLGFRYCPKPVFEKINLKDEAQFARVVTRMAELGILTPEQAFETLESGLYPDKEELLEAQTKYKEERDKGLWTPLLGGSNQGEGKDGRPNGTGTPKAVNNVGAKGKGLASEEFSAKRIQSVFEIASQLEERAIAGLKKKHEVKKLNKKQADAAHQIVKTIVESNKIAEWDNALAGFLEQGKLMEDSTFIVSVMDLAAEKDLDMYQASVMLNSKEIPDPSLIPTSSI
jgi:hypothetical protein